MCRTYILSISITQVGWVLLALAHTSIPVSFACIAVLVALEMAGPVIADRMQVGTPWHAHHIAERYGLLVIIALGEGLIGTLASLSAIITEEGWTLDVALLGLAGVGVTFGMWWTYFVIPSGDILSAHRERSFGWGYGHIPFFGALVAVGAGLHAAAYLLEGHSELSGHRDGAGRGRATGGVRRTDVPALLAARPTAWTPSTCGWCSARRSSWRPGSRWSRPVPR